MSDELALSVVMVTLNEERAIEKVVGDLQRAAPLAEILIIDSSTDRTAELAEKMGCRVIKQVPPQGYGPALGTALRAANGSVIVTLDCDDTYPAEEIPRMLKKMSEGFDLVAGSRMQKRSPGMSLQNYCANWIFAFIARHLCRVDTSDVHTGMRAYRRELLHAFDFDANGMALPVELIVGPAQKGFRCAEISIDYRPRIGQTTLRPIEGTIWTLRRLWKWRR